MLVKELKAPEKTTVFSGALFTYPTKKGQWRKPLALSKRYEKEKF